MNPVRKKHECRTKWRFDKYTLQCRKNEPVKKRIPFPHFWLSLAVNWSQQISRTWRYSGCPSCEFHQHRNNLWVRFLPLCPVRLFGSILTHILAWVKWLTKVSPGLLTHQSESAGLTTSPMTIWLTKVSHLTHLSESNLCVHVCLDVIHQFVEYDLNICCHIEK